MTRVHYLFAALIAAGVLLGVLAQDDDQPSKTLAFAAEDTETSRTTTTPPTSSTTRVSTSTTTTSTTTTTATPLTTTTTVAAPTTTTTAPVRTTTPSTTSLPPGNELTRANAHSLALLNQLRRNLDLEPLAIDPTMSAFAADWSQTMSSSGFEHSSGPYAENIVWYSNDRLTPEQAAASFHDSWVNSPGHYANMTNDRWTLAGIGLYRDSGGWWGTHVFR